VCACRSGKFRSTVVHGGTRFCKRNRELLWTEIYRIRTALARTASIVRLTLSSSCIFSTLVGAVNQRLLTSTVHVSTTCVVVPYQNLTLAINWCSLVSGTASESRLLTTGFHMQMTPSPKTSSVVFLVLVCLLSSLSILSLSYCLQQAITGFCLPSLKSPAEIYRRVSRLSLKASLKSKLPKLSQL